MDWHSYINESPYEAFVNSDDYKVWLKLCDAWQKLFAIRHGDLRYKNVAKKIVQEKTQSVAVAKGHPPYCFRFQCLTTGRKSKFIKESDYYLFGITKANATNGDGYEFATEIVDKLQPIQTKLLTKMAEIRSKAFPSTGGMWWLRYNEYLASDEWFSIREKVLSRDNYRCQITGIGECLQVHHLTYRNVGREPLSDLVTLSKAAHEIVHDRRSQLHEEYVRKIKAAA